MKKHDALAHWRSLAPGQNPLAKMQPVPYKTTGSRYGCCGVRIDGTPEFIDAVLSCLKALLAGENAITRLELARNMVRQSPGYAAGENAAVGAEVCYVRLHMRGHEGSMALAMLGGKEIERATREFADCLGVSD